MFFPRNCSPRTSLVKEKNINFRESSTSGALGRSPCNWPVASVAVASDGYQKMSVQQKGLDNIDPAPEVDSHSLCRSLALSHEPEVVKNTELMQNPGLSILRQDLWKEAVRCT